jgi:mannan endo-1,4-beta-mannosidase
MIGAYTRMNNNFRHSFFCGGFNHSAQFTLFTFGVILVLLTISSTCFAQGIKLEAENGSLQGSLQKATSISGYSGTGYVKSFDNTGDTLTVTTVLAQEGVYKLYVCYAASSDKVNNIRVNGSTGEFRFRTSNTFKEIYFCKVKLKTGVNRIGLTKRWGGISIDYFRIELTAEPETPFNVPNQLVSANASNEARSLYKFLLDTIGEKVISGLMTQDHNNSAILQDNEWIKSNTGKYPALLGFDFMNHNRSYSWYNKMVNINEAIKHSRKNGIVEFNWHWRDPLKTTDEFNTSNGTSGTTFNVAKVTDPTSNEYKAMVTDIDTVAQYLKILQDSLVPVLFRPLHEAAGAWFWWGAKGATPCKALWQLMFDQLVNHHGINNLIWVWTTNTYDDDLSWYPGDQYVDIVGQDLYQEKHGDTESLKLGYLKIKEDFGGRKLITLSENGTIPDPDKMKDEGAGWLYFMPWYGSFVTDGVWNPSAHWQKVMNHNYVLTLDEMPDLKNYPFTGTGLVSVKEAESTTKAFNVFMDNDSHILHVLCIGLHSEYEIYVYGITGKLYHNTKSSDDNFSLPMNNDGPGIYIIRIVAASGSESYKIFKN